MTINNHGAPGYTLTLGSPQTTTGPADQYGESPQNGNYVSIPVTMKALANVDSFDMPYSGDFYIVTPSGQHIDTDAGNAMFAAFGRHLRHGYAAWAGRIGTGLAGLRLAKRTRHAQVQPQR